ncbi:MAG TPA: hypothetical protein PKH77_03425 [Anaerolineae bacterium]|nr:hypothetical protein [Anaerolineae bacterium]
MKRNWICAGSLLLLVLGLLMLSPATWAMPDQQGVNWTIPTRTPTTEPATPRPTDPPKTDPPPATSPPPTDPPLDTPTVIPPTVTPFPTASVTPSPTISATVTPEETPSATATETVVVTPLAATSTPDKLSATSTSVIPSQETATPFVAGAETPSTGVPLPGAPTTAATTDAKAPLGVSNDSSTDSVGGLAFLGIGGVLLIAGLAVLWWWLRQRAAA